MSEPSKEKKHKSQGGRERVGLATEESEQNQNESSSLLLHWLLKSIWLKGIWLSDVLGENSLVIG